MKGIFNNILILSCAGVLSTVLATSVNTTSSMRFYELESNKNLDSNKIDSLIEEKFDSETKDDCLKAILSIYKVHKFIEEGNMDDGCNPVNKYGKYLESNFDCPHEKYTRYFITTGMSQRNYLCSKNANEYCNTDATNRNNVITENEIKNKFCSASAGNTCKTEYAKYMNSLKYAFYGSPKLTIESSVSDKNNENKLFSLVVHRVEDEVLNSAENLCIDENNSIKKQKMKVSLNGKCGSEDGICPSGYCCSEYGWCGTSSQHCEISSGCQSEFGKCNKETNTTITTTKTPTTTTKTVTVIKNNAKQTISVSTTGKCGPKDGRCPTGNCCSKSGWCGKSDLHCKSGCQSEFGKCE